MSRRTYALIEQDGERQCVLESTLDGHDEATVIARGIAPPPEHHAGFDVEKRRWIPDPDRKRHAERHRHAVGLSRLELLEMIEALEARVAALEAKHADQ